MCRVFLTMLMSTSGVKSDGNSLDAYIASLRRPPRDFAEWIVRIAGKDALACGYNSSREQIAASRDCAQRAISSPRPFRISYQGLEADHSGWAGVARNASGKTWLVDYDNGESMPGRERPRSITIVTCHKLALENGRVECADPTDNDE